MIINSFDILRNIDNKLIINLLKETSDLIIMPHYGKLSNNQIKSKKRADDFVTIADSEAEAYLTPKLLKIIPNSVLIGEEASSNDFDIFNKSKYSPITWTCDPIDGTYNYVKGLDNFCTMVSLCLYKKPIAAWMYFPVFKVSVYTNLNNGLFIFKNDLKLRVFRENNLFKVKYFNGSFNIDDLFEGFKKELYFKSFYANKNLRCAGYECISLACNKIDFMHHKHLTPWDHSPVDIILRESNCFVKTLPYYNDFTYDSKEQLLGASSEIIWNNVSKYLI